MDKTILAEYADMKEEVKDLRKRIRKLESEISDLEWNVVTDSVACGKKGKKPLRTVKITGIPNGLITKKKISLNARKAMLVEKESELLEMMNLAEEDINSIEKSELRMMFRFYYVDDMTWEMVAMRMNYAFPNRKIPYTKDNCRIRHDRYLEKVP